MNALPCTSRAAWAALSAWCALLAPAWSADGASEAGDLSKRYAATAPLALVPQEGLQRLTLPLPVLQASRSPQWADVRVLDAQGRPVPTAWLPSSKNTADGDHLGPTTPLPRFAWPSVQAAGSVGTPGGNLRVQVDSAGAVVKIEAGGPPRDTAAAAPAPSAWLLDLSALPRSGHPIRQLLLDWPRRAEGLSTSVQVEASDDARHWVRITAGPLLELPGTPAASTSAPSTETTTPGVRQVDWPTGVATPRYLRLLFDQPLDLSGAAVRLHAAPAPETPAQGQVQFLPVAADAQTPFHWALDLQGAVPVRQLQLALPQVNTVLGMRLEQRVDERQPWRTVTPFVAWRLQRDGREQQSAAVEWGAPPASAARYWRLVPDSRTAQLPAQPLNATIGWRAPQLLVVAQGGGALRLAVGREKDAARTVDWTTLVPGADTLALARLPEAGLGALEVRTVTQPGFAEQLKESSSEDHRRWMLWAVLGVAVLGLGVLAWRLSLDMKAGKG